jgi:hypothetical protein
MNRLDQQARGFEPRLDLESKRPSERGFSVPRPQPVRTSRDFSTELRLIDEIATFFSYLIRILLNDSFLSPKPISIGWTYEIILSYPI